MVSGDLCSCLRSAGFRTRNQLVTSSLSRRSAAPSVTTVRQGVRNSSTETSTTAQTATPTPQDPVFDLKLNRKQRLRKHNYFKTSAGVILCRSPIITRELSEFEKAFYDYQQHLKSRLSSPFPTDFYFTKGSLASKRWLAGEEERSRANELIAKSDVSTSETGEITGQEREMQEEEDVASNVAVSRITESDRKGDTKSLDRKLDRTLFLLMKKPRSKHAWQFPQGAVGAGEVLHESTSRILATLAGKDMNTWTVGRAPVGHIAYPFDTKEMGYEGNKVFFLKSRIFAGQCKLQQGSGVEDFGWFTREEIEEKVDPSYWKTINCLLSSQ